MKQTFTFSMKGSLILSAVSIFAAGLINSATAQCRFPQSIYTQNFGVGARPPATPLTIGQVPFLDYQAPPANMDPEKIYTVTPTSDLHSNANVWHHVGDHTGSVAAPGRMMLINDREPTGVVYQDIIPQASIGDGQLCYVSYWLMNILRPGVCSAVGNNPDIFMNILVQYEKPAGTWTNLITSPIVQYSSTAVPTWLNQGVAFITPTSASGSFLNIRFQINNNSVVLCGNDFVIDDISVTQCAGNIALPLDLLNFKGNRTNSAIELNWNTANEDNVAGFQVERSVNGRDFTPLRAVNAIGNGANVYGTTDMQPVAGRNYYRLKMIDNDSKFKYSQVISLNWDVKGGKVLIFPNPATDHVNIELPQEWKAGAEVFLYGANGQEVLKRKYQATSVINIPLSGINNGVYMLKVKQVNGDAVIMQKLSVSK